MAFSPVATTGLMVSCIYVCMKEEVRVSGVRILAAEERDLAPAFQLDIFVGKSVHEFDTESWRASEMIQMFVDLYIGRTKPRLYLLRILWRYS